jgi:hypothetical protein
MNEFRLGDIIDDYCVKCRRLTNHAIVSVVGEAPAKVRCRTCYSDHDYRREEIPPSKRELKKLALFNEVLASVDPAANRDGDSAAPVDPSAKPARKTKKVSP